MSKGSITINLASHPFKRERAQNAAYALICLALTISLLTLISFILHERAQAADLRKRIDAEQAELARVRADQSKFSIILGRPDNADIFSTSVLLNEMIARRAVSWTRVFEDLSTVIPPNMRLMGIRLPQVPTQDRGGMNHVQLDMVLGTDRPEAVIALLKRLEESNLFGSAAMVSQTPPTQNDPLYKYRVTVAYAQKL